MYLYTQSFTILYIYSVHLKSCQSLDRQRLIIQWYVIRCYVCHRSKLLLSHWISLRRAFILNTPLICKCSGVRTDMWPACSWMCMNELSGSIRPFIFLSYKLGALLTALTRSLPIFLVHCTGQSPCWRGKFAKRKLDLPPKKDASIFRGALLVKAVFKVEGGIEKFYISLRISVI
jgi:hypothetical protein